MNGSGSLAERVASCQERLGRGPNIIPVDFYDLGDVVAYSRDLNASGALLTRRPAG